MVITKILQRSFLNNFLLIFCFTVFFIPSVFAQSNLQLSIDVAQFQDSKQQPYIEIYYSISEQSIKYVLDTDDKYSSQLVMNLLIYKNESLWASKIWKLEKSLKDTTRLDAKKQIIDMFRYLLDEPAQYRIVIYARDMNQEGAIDSIETKIKCNMFSSNELELSYVELASQIKKLNNQSSKAFIKNNYEVIPNPTLVYGAGLPIIYYYFEVYNLLNNIDGTEYKCFAFIKDCDGEIVNKLGNLFRIKKKLHDFSVEMGQINVSELPTGHYFFVYGISDSAGAELSSKEKRFYIYNPSLTSTPAAQIETDMQVHVGTLRELEIMTNEELDMEFKRMIYLTTQEDKDFYDNLTNPKAKRHFIYSVWKSKTNEEGLKEMNYRQLYLSRVQEANVLFKAMGREGWKTDQGRVFILYGPPTNIERFPSLSSNKPYQIWTYDNLQGQGGVTFIFADRFGFNRYELIHSTLRGELQDPNWRRFVLMAPEQK